jgi:imidazolonepropionase-like amidohydrolase
MTGAVTAAARVEYAYWPQDPAIPRARAGGVTTALILPGSANLIGGRGQTVVMRPGRTIDDVRFPGAAPTIKMACGENPKRVHGSKAGPMTRMAEGAAFRATFQAAAEYRDRLRRFAARRPATDAKGKPAEPPEPPPRDLALETLAGVLDGTTLVQIHCYRADDLRQMIAIADEAGFRIRAFHHALDAYKIRDLLAAKGIAVATWADWWGGKLEMFDGIPENAALVAAAGGRAIIHSDSALGIQRLNQEAAKAMYAGRAAGLAIDDDQALRWITANPAWAVGLDDVIGTLEVGKRADVVLWSGDPFSVYARAEVVIQGGAIAYRARDGIAPSDFELENSSVSIGGTP